MASVQIYNSRGVEYVRIVESFRDPVTKKPKVRTLKNLGRKDVLEKDDPGIVERLKEELQNQRQVRKNAQALEVKSVLQEIFYGDESNHQAAELRNYGYLVYEAIWNALNLDYFFDYRQKTETKIDFPLKKAIFNLTALRLLEPSSKSRAYENQSKLYGLDQVQLHQIYRSLSFLFEQKENLLTYLHKKVSGLTNRELSVCFYDVTTLYFESVEQDALRRFGFSKDNKINEVQVVLGLLIDTNGIPVYYDLFPGNTSDFRTLEPVLDVLKNAFNIRKMIITADRGLNSKSNLAVLRKHGYDYVMAYKIRTASREIKEMITDRSDYKVLNADILYKETNLEQSIRLEGETFHFTDRFVLTYSDKRAEKDRRDRERLVEKALKLTESKSRMKAELKKGGKKYIQLSLEDLDLEVDQKKIDDDGKFDGYYGIVSSDKNLSAEEVLVIYKGLWKIEESFRVLKSNLSARLMFVWSEASIEGHIMLCFLSLTIQRTLEHLLKTKGLELSTEAIQSSLKSAKVSLVENDHTRYYLKNEADEHLKKILEALELKDIPTMGKDTQIRLRKESKQGA